MIFGFQITVSSFRCIRIVLNCPSLSIDSLYINLLILRYNNQILKLLKELILCLLGEAGVQIIIKQLDYLNDDIFLILVNLWWLRLLLIILILIFIELFDPILKLTIHLGLHKIIDCDQLEDLEKDLAVLHKRLLSFQLKSVRMLNNKILKISDRNVRLHSRIKVFNG